MDCNFYEGRICIMMEDERPCDRCDVVSMWWEEKDKQLALRDAEEIVTPLENKLSGFKLDSELASDTEEL